MLQWILGRFKFSQKERNIHIYIYIYIYMNTNIFSFGEHAFKGGRHTQNQRSLKQTHYFSRKRTSLVNKGQNMLHKLSLQTA